LNITGYPGAASPGDDAESALCVLQTGCSCRPASSARFGVKHVNRANKPASGSTLIKPESQNRFRNKEVEGTMEADKKKMLERKLRELIRQADQSPESVQNPLKPKPMVTRVIRRRKGTPDRAIA
jgi:hypothetical protein